MPCKDNDTRGLDLPARPVRVSCTAAAGMSFPGGIMAISSQAAHAVWRRAFVVVLLLLLPAPRVSAQDTGSRLLATAGGTVAGVAGGGYIALSVIVAEARAGRYLHDMKDVLGWRSLPVIGGGVGG